MTEASGGGVTRRRFLGGLGLAGGGLGIAAAFTGGSAAGAVLGLVDRSPDGRSEQAAGAVSTPGRVVPFRGRHQAGIITPAQDRLVFGAFDVVTDSAGALRDVLDAWTIAAEAMTQGRPVPGDDGSPHAPPTDTGEAIGLPPAALTVTIGYGPRLFARFGLATRRPSALAELPPLPGDRLDPARCGGDICIQACSDDPQVAFHAVRNVTRLGRGVVVLRWLQLGFGRTSSTTTGQQTPRNLMGFKDGTRNLRADDTAALDRHVWIGTETDQPWLIGGSYLVARRIRMLIEAWDRASLSEQERVIGRRKVSGAPLTGSREYDPPDFSAVRAGELVIPSDAHIRLASPEHNAGRRMLRRGYSYTDGIDLSTGELDAGLFFISFHKDPATFIAVQRILGTQDALREYIVHTGSALFVCPPGLPDGESWGRQLFGA
jgi:deferrochelatase/peroxidase EfeB